MDSIEKMKKVILAIKFYRLISLKALISFKLYLYRLTVVVAQVVASYMRYQKTGIEPQMVTFFLFLISSASQLTLKR